MILCLTWIVAVTVVKVRERIGQSGKMGHLRPWLILLPGVLPAAAGVVGIDFLLMALEVIPWPGFSLPLLLRFLPQCACVPWLWYYLATGVTWLLYGWLAWAALAAVCRMTRRGGKAHPFSGSGWPAILGFSALATSGYAAIGDATMHSTLWPAKVIGWIWLVYLAASLLSGTHRKPDGPAAQVLFRMNVAFLALALAAVPVMYAYGHSIHGLISTLDYHVPATGQYVFPRLIAKGNKAVGPLIAAAEEALESKEEFEPGRILMGTTFCLARIGGDRARAYLSKLVREKVDLQDFDDERWQKTACFAYGEFASDRAVEDLIDLFNRCASGEPKERRWCALVALARTTKPKGILFALEHIDELREARSDYSRAAEATVVVLLAESDPKAFRRIRPYVYAYGMPASPLPDPSTGDLSAEFYGLWEDSLAPIKVPEGIDQLWDGPYDKVKERWRQALALAE